ncbi:Twinfilin-1 [Rhodotorula kratochvilovae]
MAAQSGIAPTQELTDQWATVIADPNTRILKIAIKDEQLVPAGTFASTASEDAPNGGDDAALKQDFELFTQDGVVEDKTPAYYVFRLSPPPSSTFLFISYVPDHAPVRAKMLYASTRSTLVRALGDSRIVHSVFATSRADLTHASYLSHLAHTSASAPLTAREHEMAAIRAAEAASSADSAGADVREGRSMVFGAGAGAEGSEGDAKGVLPWSEEAKEAVKGLGQAEGDEGRVVQLEIDVPNETVVLSSPQPSSLADLPLSSPAYVFYRHAAGIVLIYSCPPSSPIKHRLLYSSAALVLYRVAAPRLAGVTVLKKLETDDPTEVSPEWITAELGALAAPAPSVDAEEAADSPAASAPQSGAATPLPQDDKPKFARPTRPGRKR